MIASVTGRATSLSSRVISSSDRASAIFLSETISSRSRDKDLDLVNKSRVLAEVTGSVAGRSGWRGHG